MKKSEIKKIIKEELFQFKKENFQDLCWKLEDVYDWDYIEFEGKNRVRFDWDGGERSLWINDDGTTDGESPPEISGLL